MKRFPSKSLSENPKSAIQNLKWLGRSVIAFVFVMVGAVVDAQQTTKLPRIGVLDTSTASSSAAQWQVFRHELSKLGWIEGKNIAFEYRFVEQKSERLPELAADLVGLKVDLIVITAGPAAAAAKKATPTIPIVMTTAADPVGAGLIASLARPGANVTGLASLAPELSTKRLEILKDSVPKLTRVGLLRWPGTNITADLQLKELRAAALELKIKLQEIEMRPDPKGLESAFQTAKQKQADAIMTGVVCSLPRESGSSSLPEHIDFRPFTHRANMSTRAGSCPTGRTSMSSIRARPVT